MPHASSGRFRWQQDDALVAVAPWCLDPAHQRTVQAVVRVSEQATPQYALRFELLLAVEPEETARKRGEEHVPKSTSAMDTRPPSPSPLRGPRLRVTRLVTAAAMTHALELAFLGDGDGQETKMQRQPPLCNGDFMANSLEHRMRRWLAQGGAHGAPCKEDVARWLLSRMLLVSVSKRSSNVSAKRTCHWAICLFGEKGAEPEVEGLEGEDADAAQATGASGAVFGDNLPSRRHTDCNVDPDVAEAESEHEDELPPYEEFCRQQPDSPREDVAVDGESLLHEQAADESAPPGVVAEATRRQSDQPDSRQEGAQQSTSIRPAAAWPAQTPDRRRDPRGSLQAMGRRGSCRDAAKIPTTWANNQCGSKLELQPTVVCLHQRRCSLGHGSSSRQETPNEWSEDLRHFQQELRALQRDLQAAEQQHGKVQQLAELRRDKLVKETTRKLRRSEQRQRDARAVRQLLADTLEYKDEVRAVATRVKRTANAAQREQERVRQRTRVALGKTDKAPYGGVRLGSGPISQRQLELERHEAASSRRDVVFDLHGHRRHAQEARLVAAESDLKSAMTKVRRLLLRPGIRLDLFRRYDLDRSGTLSYDEFQRLLRETGTGDWAALTHDQSVAFFEHLDADGSGEVDYVELLWGFFNRRAFAKRWRERKWLRSPQEVKLLFDRFDRSGSGTLPLRAFQLAMDHLGVCLSDDDAKLLAIQFGVNDSDSVDYDKFLLFVDNGDSGGRYDGCGQREEAAVMRPKPVTSKRMSDVRPTESSSDGTRRIWRELRAVSETQTRLRRLISK